MNIQTEEFEARKQRLLRVTVDAHIEKMERIERHTYAQCQSDDHLWESHATGGRDGHIVSRCQICGYATEGWD